MIIHAVLHDVRYDRQSEQHRAPYLYQILQATGEPDWYTARLCDALQPAVDGGVFAVGGEACEMQVGELDEQGAWIGERLEFFDGPHGDRLGGDPRKDLQERARVAGELADAGAIGGEEAARVVADALGVILRIDKGVRRFPLDRLIKRRLEEISREILEIRLNPYGAV